MFVQEAEPGPPKSRNEKSSYPGAAGTQRRPGEQARPGAGDLTHHRVGWAVPSQKELKPVKKPSAAIPNSNKPTAWGFL